VTREKKGMFKKAQGETVTYVFECNDGASAVREIKRMKKNYHAISKSKKNKKKKAKRQDDADGDAEQDRIAQAWALHNASKGT
jgi:hypothetical protein